MTDMTFGSKSMQTYTLPVANWLGHAVTTRNAILPAVVVVAALLTAQPSSAQSLTAPSAWTNQRGSTLYVDSVEPNTGKITGHYINRAAGYGCQNLAYPVTGWAYGTAVTFATTWQNPSESCNSITSWTGSLNQGQITTLWQLVVNGSTSTNQITQGADTFSQSMQTNRKSLLLEKQ
ncbi:avidin/streptavidin family protein [Ralstonia solanacearum]|uniref:Avidin family protein n=1 Tax=Ralstonia solanacearum TaxID=305 RepID=A0A5H2PIK8_RALSL|nr:avidin/streptavidin family protein [Ralstonia solanacearum]AYB59280.1 hypothetical protein C2124_01010 [Ralstonia solanacearum]MCG3575282.1 avidin/streptavidin family protein [Ralstonia solanacearum]MDC6298755.1 avidin/streptavidin family protein [Ralstonia solanacearum]MDC6314016.1 avidin/streptavidin family protein [Ralstonia solanacearum]